MSVGCPKCEEGSLVDNELAESTPDGVDTYACCDNCECFARISYTLVEARVEEH